MQSPAMRPQEIPQQTIHLKMTEGQVVKRLGPPYRTVGVKEYPDGVMEVRHYIVDRVCYVEDTGSKKEFYLYFWNRELVRWDRPDEWEAEADRIHESVRTK